MRRISAICGTLAQKPRHGGHTWVFLQYLLGFRRLGWDVTFIDQVEAEQCVDAAGRSSPVEQSYNLATLREIMSRFGFDGSWGLLHDAGRQSVGLTKSELLE